MIRSVPLIGLILVLLTSPSPGHAGLRFGPYLQSLAPGVVSVCAFVDEGDTVLVRLIEPGEAPREFAAEGAAPACAKLSGLLPNVDYRYQLFVDGECAAGEEPLAFVASSEPEQTFVIYGDTRSGDDSFDLAHRQVVRAIRETTVPDAAIHTGDFVERGDDPELWESFFHIERDFLSTTPIFPAIGRSDQPPELMGRLFPRLARRPWYSFDRGEVHVAVLNLWQASRQEEVETAPDGAQARWLRDDLAGARARGGRYLFVVLHEPVINLAGKSSSTARQVYMPIFEAFGVTAVFSGAHYFSHAVVNEVHYFTNGGGGALLEAREPKKGVFRFYSAVHHFLVLEVGRFRARVKAVNAYGEDFYETVLGGRSESPGALAAPTTVMTFGSGEAIVAMTVFSRPGCEACEGLEAELPGFAREAGATLVVTFRSLEDAGNRAALQALTDRDGPAPIISLNGDILTGMEEIEGRLVPALIRAAEHQEEEGKRAGLWILAAAVVILGAALLLFLLKGRPVSHHRKSSR